MLIACLGDIMLDVLVSSELDMVPDGDTPATIDVAAGGQAANVAAWAKALGAAGADVRATRHCRGPAASLSTRSPPTACRSSARSRRAPAP